MSLYCYVIPILLVITVWFAGGIFASHLDKGSDGTERREENLVAVQERLGIYKVNMI
jgi:hypothetical protein